MNSYTVDARNAYAAWAAAQGAEPRIYTAGSGLSEDAGYEATVKMFAEGWRPDAIYATVDRLALGSLRAIKDQGLVGPGGHSAGRPERQRVGAVVPAAADRSCSSTLISSAKARQRC